MQLKGGAQELARGYPPQTLIQGGLINGVQADPLTYVIHGLAERFAALGEELRLGSITELLSFSRNHHQHERIDEILVRFDVARQRAHDEGQLTVSITGLTWLLLRAVGVSDSQLLQILTLSAATSHRQNRSCKCSNNSCAAWDMCWRILQEI